MTNYYFDDYIMNEELLHYGIPRRSGRYKWGTGENPYHHGRSAPGGRRIRKRKRSADYEVRLDRKKAVKNRRTMSDDELAQRIGRLEKEKKLKSLTKEDLYPGKNAVDEVLSSSGKKVLIAAASAAGTLAVEYLMRRHFGDVMPKSEMAKAVTAFIRPKKK